jgi:hypothetical protein
MAETDGGMKIDSSGVLVDGTPVRNVADLRNAVLGRSDAVLTTTVERLLTYALGRPVEYFDMPRFGRLCATQGKTIIVSHRWWLAL